MTSQRRESVKALTTLCADELLRVYSHFSPTDFQLFSVTSTEFANRSRSFFAKLTRLRDSWLHFRSSGNRLTAAALDVSAALCGIRLTEISIDPRLPGVDWFRLFTVTLPTNCAAIQKITFRSSDDGDSWLNPSIRFNEFAYLRAVDFQKCRLLSVETLASLPPTIEQIQELRGPSSDAPIFTGGYTLTSFFEGHRNLRIFVVSDLRAPSETAVLREIAQHCPQLTRLWLLNCAVTLDGLEELRGFRQLVLANAWKSERTVLTDATVVSLVERNRRLTVLSLHSAVSLLTARGYAALAELSELRAFGICAKIQAPPLSPMIYRSFIAALTASSGPTLWSLWLLGHYVVDRDQLQSIVVNCLRLNDIRCTIHYASISADSLRHIFVDYMDRRVKHGVAGTVSVTLSVQCDGSVHNYRPYKSLEAADLPFKIVVSRLW